MPKTRLKTRPKARSITIGVVTALVLGALGIGAWWMWSPGPRLATPRVVEVAAGASRWDIARQLQQEGVIRSRLGFELWCLLHPARSVKAGAYRFGGGESVPAVFATLARGRFYTIRVTIPEGFNRFEIAAELQRLGLARASAFLAATATPAAIRDLDPEAVSLEGYLFPATYKISPHTPPARIVAMMTGRFRQEVRRDQPRNVHRWVTLASLIQKETAVPAERALIGGVFTNRLRRGLPLQCDPTVIYAALLAHRYTGALHRADLRIASPYNTYLHTGLPPGPIANPGRASLEAAAHPDQTAYLYFVSNGDGAHRFARTLAQQEKNIRLYVQTLRAKAHGGG